MFFTVKGRGGWRTEFMFWKIIFINDVPLLYLGTKVVEQNPDVSTNWKIMCYFYFEGLAKCESMCLPLNHELWTAILICKWVMLPFYSLVIIDTAGWIIWVTTCIHLLLFDLFTENRIFNERGLHAMPRHHWIWKVWDSDLVLVALPAWIFKVMLLLHDKWQQFLCPWSCILFQWCWSANQSCLFCLHQITKALSVWVLSKVHEKQKHSPETHKEVWLVPPAGQWNLQKRWPFRIWG